jgi:drug/metabolite transporter (DMT)-like permease
VLLGFLFLGDPISALAIVGMAIVLFGVYLVARPRRDVIAIDNTPPLPPRQLVMGVITAVGAALAWSAGTVIVAFGLTDGINNRHGQRRASAGRVLVSLTAAGRQGGLVNVRR